MKKSFSLHSEYKILKNIILVLSVIFNFFIFLLSILVTTNFFVLIFETKVAFAESTHVAAFNTTEDVPTGVTFNPDGTKMYVVGINDDTIRQYTLSTGFDLSSTVTLERSRNITSLENRPQDLSLIHI